MVSAISVNTSFQLGHYARSGAILVGKVALGTLAFAAVTAGTGSLLGLVAPHSGAASVVLEVAGKYLFQAGRYAFLSVAVPVYAATWAIPKWVVTKGIPTAALYAQEYVLIPVYNGLVQLAGYIETVAQAIYTHVLLPFSQMLVKVATWTWEAVLLPIGTFLKGVINEAALAIYNYVLKPIGNACEWFWNQVVVQVLKSIEKAAILFYTSVLKPLATAIAETIQWTWNTVIVPFAKGIYNIFIQAVEAFYNHVLKPLGQVAEWIWSQVIIPAANAIQEGFIQVAKVIYEYALVPLAKVVERIAKDVAVVARFVFDNFFYPIGLGIYKIAAFTWSSLLVPAATLIKNVVVVVAELIYQYVLAPTGQFIQIATTAAIDATYAMVNASYEACTFVARGLGV